jgi:hypothetical protein
MYDVALLREQFMTDWLLHRPDFAFTITDR